MYTRLLTVCLFFVLLVVACTPDTKATETRIAANIFATQTASVPMATNTRLATDTPLPIATIPFYPTLTPKLIYTPTPANTPTVTPKPSPTIDPIADRKTFSKPDQKALKKTPSAFVGQKMQFAASVLSIKEGSSDTTLRIRTYDFFDTVARLPTWTCQNKRFEVNWRHEINTFRYLTQSRSRRVPTRHRVHADRRLAETQDYQRISQRDAPTLPTLQATRAARAGVHAHPTRCRRLGFGTTPRTAHHLLATPLQSVSQVF